MFLAKSAAELVELSPDSEEVGKPSILTYYAARPASLEDTCLAYFVAYYQYYKRKGKIFDDNEEVNDDDICGSDGETNEVAGRYLKLSDKLGFVRRRNRAKIVRFRKYSEGEDASNYFRELVMLYKPWRNEKSDITNHDPCSLYAQHKELIEQNRLEFDPQKGFEAYELAQLAADTERQQMELEDHPLEVGEIDREYQSFFTTEDDEDFPSDGPSPALTSNQVGEMTSATSESHTLMNDDEYLRLMNMLNYKQRTFVLAFMRKLRSQTDGFYWYLGGGK